MTHKAADRVQEVTTTVGTGPYVLSGAVPGFQTWAAGLGDGNSAYYAAQDGTRWEVGEAALSGTTLTRTTILASSSGGAAINWPAGEKKIFLDYPATRSVFVLPSGQLNAAYISMGDAPPANPIVGQMWWESDTGNSFVYYDDGNTKQWVPTNVGVAGGGGGTIPTGTMAQFDTALTDGNFVYQNQAAALTTLDMSGRINMQSFNIIGGSTGATLMLNGGTGISGGASLLLRGSAAGFGNLGAHEFYTAGIERMRITSAGNVGIGTTTPQSLLTVDAGYITTGRYGSSGALVLRSAAGTQTVPAQLTAQGVAGYLGGRGYDGAAYQELATINFWNEGAVTSTSSPGFMGFYTVPSGQTLPVERMRITSAGFTGIGTGTPTAQLTVAAQGTIHATRYGGSQPSFTFQTAGGTEAAPTPPVQGQSCGAVVWRGYDGVNNYVQLGAVGTWAEAAPTPTSSPGYMVFSTTSAGATAANEKVRITSNGDLQSVTGIFSQPNPLGSVSIFTGAAFASGGAALSLRGKDGAYNGFGMEFYTGGAERIRIDGGGNVGIGMIPIAATSSTFQLGADMALLGNNAQMLQFNAYWNGGWKVKNAGYGGGVRFDSSVGQLQLYTSPASVAANTAASLVIGAVLDKSNNFSVIGGVYTPALVQCMGSGTGFSALNPGGAALTGYIAFGAANSVRTGYIGNASTAAGGNIMYVNENGGGHVFNNPVYAPSYNPPSDLRLKDNIEPAAFDTGAVFDAIKIVQFDWRRGGKHESLGIVAQDLHEIFPEAVTPADAALDMVGPDGELIEDTWSYDLAKMTMLLLAEVKSLRARVAELEAA